MSNDNDPQATGGQSPSDAIALEDQWRADLYNFIGRLLAKPPAPELLVNLRSVQADDTDVGRAVAAIKQLAERMEISEVDAEYHRLFIGVGRGELLPYASYYLTGFLNEKPLATLRQDMSALRISRSPTTFEPEDNVASLCEMMAGLITGRFGAPAPLRAQKEFFGKHLAPWAGHFFKDLEAAENAVFFAPVGTLGKVLIDIDSEAFRMLGEDAA
ncbi:MAG: molecular chaperone TorD family protein [Pseudomonadota bacterium]